MVAAIASAIEDSIVEFRSSLAHMVSEKSSQPKGPEENFTSSALLVRDINLWGLLILDLFLFDGILMESVRNGQHLTRS